MDSELYITDECLKAMKRLSECLSREDITGAKVQAVLVSGLLEGRKQFIESREKKPCPKIN